ncbi:MAG: 50S ribosomal protein L11 methyltransferase [Proteobacteria bacterium]|nr:50S ribosomal protein L11 methyltransferase [Pseudomonadota bacterium]
MSVSWLCYLCRVREADVSLVEQYLEELGAEALTCEAAEEGPLVVDELDGHQPLWPICEVSGLFDIETDLSGLGELLKTQGVTVLDERTTRIYDQNWHESWRDQFSPQCYGNKLWVCPTWCEPPPDQDKIIRLDPGMAFGTGNHATTALCLVWLANNEVVANAKILDYGCGSGILAIAAAKMGAQRVTAVDIDDDAIGIAKDNALLNGLGEISVVRPEALGDSSFDIIVANILLEPLCKLSERFAELLSPGGYIVLSGILVEQVDQLLACYARAFRMDERVQLDEWALVAGTRKR